MNEFAKWITIYFHYYDGCRNMTFFNFGSHLRMTYLSNSHILWMKGYHKQPIKLTVGDNNDVVVCMSIYVHFYDFRNYKNFPLYILIETHQKNAPNHN